LGTTTVKSTKAAADNGSWELGVPAHNQTWMFLFMTNEILTSFPDSKGVKMQQMAWWNHAASPDVRRIDAEKKAIEMHRFFRDAMKRPYEPDFEQNSFSKAITELTKVLVVADNTVPMLATSVNLIFRFKGE
jgi:hypothetical protein